MGEIFQLIFHKKALRLLPFFLSVLYVAKLQDKGTNTSFTNDIFKMLAYGKHISCIHTKIHIMESTINPQCLKQNKTTVSCSFSSNNKTTRETLLNLNSKIQ